MEGVGCLSDFKQPKKLLANYVHILCFLIKVSLNISQKFAPQMQKVFLSTLHTQQKKTKDK